MEQANKYKKLLDTVVSKALIMNATTEFNDDVHDRDKVIQKATSLSLMEPLFDYMEENGNDAMKQLVIKYKKHIATLKKNGVIQTIDNIEEHIKELEEKIEKKKNAKDNSNTE